MRLAAAASCLFLQGCIAFKPRTPLLHGRQYLHFDGETLTTVFPDPEASTTTTIKTIKTNEPSITCDAELSLFIDSMPTEAVEMPEHTSFSSSYYEDHPRTAHYPVYECDWIAEIPEDLDEAAMESYNKTDEWFLAIDPHDDKEIYNYVKLYEECVLENSEYIPCRVELDDYRLGVVKRTERAKSQEDAEGEDAESGGGRGMEFLEAPGIAACVVATIGAAFSGFL